MKVWVVDDEPVLRRTLAARLGREPGWSIAEFGNGAELLAAVEESAPDLIVMDVDMPVMDGLEACRMLRQRGHDGVRVIFVSGDIDPARRHATYASGGDDFVAKPFDFDELACKARAAGRTAKAAAAAAAEIDAARQAAMEAMVALAETGAVLQFMRASFAAAGPDAVAQAAFDTLREYGLGGLMEIRIAGTAECYADKGECTPADAAVLAHMRQMERLFEFHGRLAINYPHVTLVVRGLDADAVRAGRLRDQVMLLAEACDARIEAMAAERRRAAQNDGIADAVAAIGQAIEEVERNQADLRLRASEIDADYLEDMVRAFVVLGLSDEQEASLADMAERAHARFGELRDYDCRIGEQLHELARRLASVAED